MSWIYARATFFTCDGCGDETDGFVGKVPAGWREVDATITFVPYGGGTPVTQERQAHYCPKPECQKISLASVAPEALP